jgi:hypothetical protein
MSADDTPWRTPGLSDVPVTLTIPDIACAIAS